MAVVSNVEIRVNAKNAIQQFDLLQRKAKELNGTLDRTETESKQVGVSFGGLAAKITALIGGVATLKKGLDTAFARGAAEQRLRNLTSSTGEYELSLKMAAVAAADFGLTQTQATQALGDTYSRLRGVGFGLQEVNEIYRGFNTIAKESGVTANDASGAFLQLGQALGSGALQGDELRSILERMPQLAQAIASEMGVAAGSIRKLGSEGKITSDVIYKALARAAESSGDFSGKLTRQQATMAQVAQRADEMFVQLGKALAPSFLTAMDGLAQGALILANGFQKVNEFASANSEKIKELLAVGLEIGKIALSVFIVVKAYQAYQKAVAAVATAKAFLLGMTGVGLKLVAVGAAAAAGAYFALNKGIDAAGNEIEKLQGESKAQLDQMKADINNSKDAYSSIPPVVDDIKKKQEQVNATLQQQTALAEQVARSQTEALTNNLSLAEARYSTEKQLLNNQIEQAKATGKIKQVYELKNKLAQLDYDISVQRIKTEVRKLEIAKQLAETKQRELQVALALVDANSKQAEKLRSALTLQQEAVKQAARNLSVGREIAKEQLNHTQAIKEGAIEANNLALQMERADLSTASARANATGLKNELAAAASNAARVSSSAAQASSSMDDSGVRTMSVSTSMTAETARLAREAEIRKSGLPAEYFEMRDLAGRFQKEIERVTVKDEMGRVMNQRMIDELERGMGLAGRRAREIIEENLTRERVEEATRRGQSEIYGMYIQTAQHKVGMRGYSTSQRRGEEKQYHFRYDDEKGYASGGYVSSPTNALVGEGGSEYVIPSSKMAAAMERYAAGKRGNEVVPNGNDTQVNVSTGPVMQMNGQNYITQSDFEKGLRSTVNQVMTALRRSPNTRAAVGI